MKLIRANVNDCEKIWKMQTEAFSDLLERYQDYETSPGNEAKERIEAKLSQEFTYFYYIFDGDNLVGAIRVVDKKDGSRKIDLTIVYVEDLDAMVQTDEERSAEAEKLKTTFDLNGYMNQQYSQDIDYFLYIFTKKSCYYCYNLGKTTNKSGAIVENSKVLQVTSFEYDMGNIVPKDIKYCLISIAKEAITNAVKHSNGDQLSILIREHPGFYQLIVKDNGTDIKINNAGIGLANITDRVNAMKGTLKISTDKGFKLLITVAK